MRSIYLAVLFLFIFLGGNAQYCTLSADSILKGWFGKDPLVDKVLEQKDGYRLQMMLSVPCGDSLKEFSFTEDKYYYPASLVKFPTVMVALEKMKEQGVDLDDKIVLKDIEIDGNKTFIRKTQSEGISFRELITKTIVISDNDYYNVLYHYVTPRYLNQKLKEKGFDDVLIYRCFNGCSKEDQLITAGYSVYTDKGELKITQDSDIMNWEDIRDLFPYDDDKKIGMKTVSKGKVSTGPYDFNENLEFPVISLHRMLISFISDTTGEVWLNDRLNRQFLLEKMKEFPADIGETKYKQNDFKIIGFGDQSLDNSRFTTHSKIGYSYGFITETACVRDKVSGKDFYLTISMYVNKNNTINDGRYEYGSVATPFMGKLTHFIADGLIDK